MTWELRSAVTKKVTKQLVAMIAGMTPAPGDRPLSTRRLEIYRAMIEQCTFRPCTWAIATTRDTEESFRVNGKHTSTLMSQFETLPELYVTLEEYVCDTVEDVARLYGTFDSRMATRTSRDINYAFASAIDELKHVRQKAINISVTGMSWFKYRAAAHLKPAAERAELLAEHKSFVLWVNDIIAGDPKAHRHLLRGAVGAAMFATWLKSQKDSTVFWIAVRDETGTKPSCPDRKLAKYLSTISIATSSSRYSQKQSSSTAEMYAKCLHAWNAWRRGEQTDLKFYASAKLPEAK